MNPSSSGSTAPTALAQAGGCTVMATARRVLERTAHSLASSPGGLRFVAGSHPWLPPLSSSRSSPLPARLA